jgi:hypothetical protein
MVSVVAFSTYGTSIADTDPPSHFEADPDPHFHFNADPVPDPAPHQSYANLHKDPSWSEASIVSVCTTSWLHSFRI